MDREIGRVLDYLESSGLAENTLVIYMGDNGFSFGEHGLIDKRHAYEESMRVPMLAWAPGYVEAGTTIDEMVVNTDIAPTLLELAGTQMPDGHVVDGRSMLPLLDHTGGAAPDDLDWRDEVLYEYYWEWNFPQTPAQFALRTDRYKYMYFYGLWGKNALFDLEEDPIETYNLIDDEAHQERRVALRERLFEQLEATDGDFIPLRGPRGSQQDDRRPEGAPSTDPLVQEQN
jgi:N-acetylglucosamine-6-sulfatase